MPGFWLRMTKEPSNGVHAGLDGIELGWAPMAAETPPGAATDVAAAMVREAGFQACGDCHWNALARLDFSRTSSLLDWNGDEFEVLTAEAAPPSLCPLVRDLMEEGWTLELTSEQLRLLDEGAVFYEMVPLLDRFDQEELGKAEETIEAIHAAFFGSW